MSEKNEKRLKAVKTIYGKEAFEKGLKIKYGNNTFIAWWILGFNTIEELEANKTIIPQNVKTTFSKILFS